MSAKTPEDVIHLVGKYVNEGKMDKLLALYEDTATFIPQPGKVVNGRNQIRDAFVPFLAMEPILTTKSIHKVIAGDVAMLYVHWSLTGKGPEGQPMSMEGLSTDVVRRQRDGTWKAVIDNPWGVATLR